MRSPSWLRSLTAHLRPTRDGRPPRRKPFRPRVEVLEDRAVPSAAQLTTQTFSGGPSYLSPVGSTLYFEVGNGFDNQFWRTDGRPGDAVPVESGSQIVSPNAFHSHHSAQIGSWFYFFTDNSDGTYTLWRNNSAVAPTGGISRSDALVTLSPDSPQTGDPDGTTDGFGPYQLSAVGHDLYFGDYTAGSGWALWKTTGADGGNPVTAPFAIPGSDSNGPYNLWPAGSNLFFSAYFVHDSSTDFVMWVTDGTPGGTVPLRDAAGHLVPGGPNSFPDEFAAAGSDLYYIAGGVGGVGDTSGVLWRLHGSGQPAERIASGLEAVFGMGNGPAFPMTVVGNTLYFAATDPASPSGQYQLWKYDGSTATPFWESPPIFAGDYFSPLQLVGAGPYLYFTDGLPGGDDGSGSPNHEPRLWRTDGTANGTQLLKVFLTPPVEGGVPLLLTVVGSAVYFEDKLGLLWQSDATSATPSALPDNVYLEHGFDFHYGAEWLRANVPLVADGPSLYYTSGGALYRLNNAPVASDGADTTNQDTALTIPVLANVLDADSADAGHLTPSVVSGPAHGSLALNADGSFTYTPVVGYVGPDSFAYQASDGTDPSNVATIALTVQSLQSALTSLPAGTTLTIQATTPAVAQDLVQALNDLSSQNVTVSGTVSLDLAPNTTYGGLTVNVPSGMTLVIGTASYTGGQQATIDPASPAFIVASGNVIVYHVTFVTAGDAPTVLVTGGSLTLRGCVVQETADAGQAAVRVTGGTLDLGTAADPGNNTLVLHGPGVFIDNQGPNSIPAVGDGFTIVKADQAITANWPARAAGVGSVTLNLASSSGLPVSYAVSGPATFDPASGRLTFTAPGTVTVTAHQAGDDYYNPAADVSTSYTVAPASLCGVLFKDFNEDGFQDFGELGVGGVVVTLTGVDFNGAPVSASAATGASGYYQFPDLLPGTYTVGVPGGVTVTKITLGLNGSAPIVVGSAAGLAIAEGTVENVVNFGVHPAAGDALHRGQTAGIGFWNNRNGQALLKALNGGAGSQLGAWLAATLPHLFGAAGHDLAGATNAQVVSYFQLLFATKGDKLEAQVLATALSVYVTNSTLAGGGYATAYGFTVAVGGGTGLATFNVGADGAAVDQANGTTMTVLDILFAIDRHATPSATAAGFTLYAGDQANRSLADDLFGRINDLGGI